ncbi:MAG: peroxiredoxin [Propionibacterium sp.]|nr:peroxiredoxin [Propionibacterium sp.]
MVARLTQGTTAPGFTRQDQEGREISLSDFKNQAVILYFYPAAMTPGCTTQAVDFSASLQELSEAGYAVLGCSPDPVEKLAKFTTNSELGITLLSDPTMELLHEYAAFGTKKLYGKEIEGVIRSTFVIDVDGEGAGTVRVAQYNVRATGHVAKLRRELGI